MQDLIIGSMLTDSARVFVIVVFFSTSIDASFLPKVATVLPDESPVFSCFSPYSDVDFQFQAFGYKDSVLIYSQNLRGGVVDKYADVYDVTSSSGYYNLTVLRVSSANAGAYSCQSNSETEKAELVVIAPASVVCVSNASNSSTIGGCGVDFRFECAVEFRGNVPPVIEFWRLSSQGRTGPISVSRNTTVSNKATNVLVQRLFSNNSGERFVCQTGYGSWRTATPLCTFNDIHVPCDSSDQNTLGGVNVAAIVVPIVFGIIAVICIILFALWVWRRFKSRASSVNEGNIVANGVVHTQDEAEKQSLLETPQEVQPADSPRNSANKLRLIELISDGNYELHTAEHEDFGKVFFERLCIRHMEEDNIRMFREEAVIPMGLSHPNVIKFLDVIFVNAENNFPGTYGLVYEYQDFGDLNDFLDMFPLEWNNKLSLLSDVASGMNYLHSQTPPIIHGDLRTEHVLIGYDFKAKVSDFSFAKWKSYYQSHSIRKVGYETVAHYPPESISNSGSAVAEKSEKFDVYSFGILFWETITQQRPFAISNTTIVSNWVLKGERPDETVISGDVTPACTSLMKACWSQITDDRPSFKKIEAKLRGELTLMNGTNIPSESLKEFKPLPDGGYFESFTANHPTMGLVVYKELSISDLSETKVLRLKSEATSLLHLNHPNLIKLMSIVTDKKKKLGLVYPFYNDGNLHQYLRKTKQPWLNRLSLLHDVACGMCFLHRQTPAIFHGDLKIKNVLVSIVREIPVAKVCDFGLPEWKMCSNLGSSVDGVQLGSLFTTPPECLTDSDLPKTKFYDVYSFGILMYQTMTLERPYTEKNTSFLTNLVKCGTRPALEKIPASLGVSQASRELMQRCWSSEAADRSDFQTITGDLRKEIQILRLENNINKIQHSELNGLIRREKFDGYFSVDTVVHATLGKVTVKKPGVKVIKFRDAIRLLKDASSYQHFDHRNILKMHALAQYDHGSITMMTGIQSRIYGIVFEHTGDHSLNEHLRTNKPPWDQKLPLVRDVASGMAYLHSLTPEVTHGDLRIENVFVREDGGSIIAKVCNFGFSLATERKSTGTIVHIPPKNLETPHHPISEAFDVYSFAVLLWQTMTLRQMQPFSKEAGQSGKTIYDLVLQENVRPDLDCISSVVPQTSIDLMTRCWSTSETDRPIFKGIVEELEREMKCIHHVIKNNVSDQSATPSV